MTTLAQLNAAAQDMLKAADDHFDALVYGDQTIAIFPEAVYWRHEPTAEADEGGTTYTLWQNGAYGGQDGIAVLVGDCSSVVSVWLLALWDHATGEAA